MCPHTESQLIIAKRTKEKGFVKPFAGVPKTCCAGSQQGFDFAATLCHSILAVGFSLLLQRYPPKQLLSFLFTSPIHSSFSTFFSFFPYSCLLFLFSFPWQRNWALGLIRVTQFFPPFSYFRLEFLFLRDPRRQVKDKVGEANVREGVCQRFGCSRIFFSVTFLSSSVER